MGLCGGEERGTPISFNEGKEEARVEPGEAPSDLTHTLAWSGDLGVCNGGENDCTHNKWEYTSYCLQYLLTNIMKVENKDNGQSPQYFLYVHVYIYVLCTGVHTIHFVSHHQHTQYYIQCHLIMSMSYRT